MRGKGKEQARSRQTMEGQEYHSTANQEQARIVGVWRDQDQGASKGETMQSREATLTNSNQRVSMGACGELASTRTYCSTCLQRHSHSCTAGAVWAGRTPWLRACVPESQDTAVFPKA